MLCTCRQEAAKERELARLLDLSGMKPAMARMTFENFRPDGPGLPAALAAASDYASNPDGWLYLRGRYGCGKTHLLAAIATELMRQRIGALYVVVPDLLIKLRATFDRGTDETFRERLDRIATCDVLLLDDLGAERSTNWVNEQLYTLINERYLARRPLVVASNLSPEAIGGRIGSRLGDRRLTTYVSIDAGDYRAGGA